MKFVVLLTMVACLSGGARGFGQSLTLSLDRAPLETVFSQIRQQTGLSFIYTRDQVARAKPVTIDVKEAGIGEVLEMIAKDQPFRFVVEGKYVVVRMREEGQSNSPPGTAKLDIRGSVVNESGNPVAGATVAIKGTTTRTTTDARGEFQFNQIDLPVTLLITGAELQAKEVLVTKDEFLMIQVQAKVGELDQVVMMAYGTTTRRLGTGNISKVTAQQIERQPVSNVLNALDGNVPGLVATQFSGLPGAPVRIEVRGRTSINPSISNDPLFVIDGVPFAPNNNPINSLNSALGLKDFGGGLSPFMLINPSEIESIEVLKDADATAIYGSMGANGVILITTKKGKPGQTKVTTTVNFGASRITRTPRMLNTEEYVALRKEGFSNDGITPTIQNAPDLLLFDTTKFTDFTDYFIGSTANSFDAQSSVSGGNSQTQFLVGANFHQESTVFPGDLKYRRGGLMFNVHHSGIANRFNLDLSGNFTTDKNNLISTDLTSLKLPPNYPDFLDEAGNPVNEYLGLPLSNPLAYLFQEYEARTTNLLSNLQLGYKILPSLQFRTSMGYNQIEVKENRMVPKKSLSLLTQGGDPYAEFADNSFQSWILEPQMEYVRNWNRSKLSILIGGTWQSTTNRGLQVYASGYPNDELINSTAGATFISAENNRVDYRYQAFFGRIHYNFNNYIITNLSARRDGSSRFGEEKRFDNFGSLGVAWIFSKALKLPAKSIWNFGKIRASYGLTGNDKIGEYKYLSRWQATPTPYQGIPGLYPLALYNPEYRWELNRKLEIGLEMAFLQNRLLLSSSVYWNRSGNQLLNYSLPAMTGFQSVVANFPAVVQNSGIELELNTSNVASKRFTWKTSFNISFPKNKLVAFPGIESSSYSHLVIGESIGLIKCFKVTGIDPSSGVYTFLDRDNDGQIGTADRVNIGDMDPQFLGGLRNEIQFKNWLLEVSFSFRKQTGRNFMFDTGVPGMYGNVPYYVLDRWGASDHFAFQKATSKVGTDAYNAFMKATQGSGADIAHDDASFLRLRNLSVSYVLSSKALTSLKIKDLRLSIRGQNLLLITSYKGADPETQSLGVLPPLKTLVFAIQLTL